ncbi:PH domain-containing protein [Candidatus Parcubacteria bacterium]|nr:PH domain-containing protein [Patescibacteria group bacterium]MCG2694122.1 PH domain-containing protein [Candidatus Parcubacteria bacterium]
MGITHLKQLISQKGYEKIKHVVRRDKLVLIFQLFYFLLLFLIPVVLYFLFKNYLPAILAHNIWHPAVLLGISVYYSAVWVFLFAAFLDYYLDTWIITNDRLLNIEQEGVFARTISELDLYRIQDATSEIKGIFPSLFGYGSVYIQTAGEKARFVLEQVPNPHELRKKIMDLAEEDRKFHNKK